MRFIQPAWPAPDNIFAYTTTRQKGNSVAPYTSFNLAQHVGDDPEHVERNRQLLVADLKLPSSPVWLQQVHSNKVAIVNENHAQNVFVADATITTLPHVICTVMTADCLPILLCNRSGTLVSAIHAGWRGLADGIIENTLHAIPGPRTELLAWLGPAIGPNFFEVAEDVLEPFLAHDKLAINAFKPQPNAKNKWLANIYLLARMRLNALGLTAIYGGEYCTFSDKERFYSYRRDGKTGRMATLIWLSA